MTPLAYMLRGGMPALITVRRLLDAVAPGDSASADLGDQAERHASAIPSRHLPAGDSVLTSCCRRR